LLFLAAVNVVPIKSSVGNAFSHFGSAKKSEAEGFIYLIFYLIAVASK
jgi:hypothetical protein